ncbi:hypothetical protein OC844_002323 [Tilletia horrida]|nr:hypothetical protein OC844_002323 [Tilletia horrida]
MNFESPGALRRRIDAAQYAEESVDELSLGMARRAPSGVDSSMLSLADSSRDLSIGNKSISRQDLMHSRADSPLFPSRQPSPHISPLPSPAPVPKAPSPSSADAARVGPAKASPTAASAAPAPAQSSQRRALTPTLAPTQDRHASSQGSTSEDDNGDLATAQKTSAKTGPSTTRIAEQQTAAPTETATSAFSVAARRIRIANGTPPGAPKAAASQQAQTPSLDFSTPRASRANSALENQTTTPIAANVTQNSYAPSTVSTTSSNDLLTPAAHKARRGNTSLPGLVGAESVLRPRPGGGNLPTSSRIASGNAAGAHVDVGKLAAYQHKINERLEEENGRLREDAEQLTTRVEELEDEVDRREAELDRALATNEELSRRLDELEKSDRRRDSNVEKMEAERRRLESRAESLQKDYNHLEADAAELREEGSKMLAELEELSAEMEQKNKDLVDAIGESERLQRRVAQLEREAKLRSSDQDRENEVVKALEAELDDEQRARRRLEREVNSLRNEKQQFEVEIEHLQKDARISRLGQTELEQLKEENQYLQKENSKLMAEAQDLMDQLEEQRELPQKQERSQTVRFDESVNPEDGPAPGRSALRALSVKSTPNKTFDLSLPNLANLSTMSWLNETTIGDQGMLAVIQQLQREVDERNLYVDDLLTKLDSYGKLLLQLGEKYELAQRKLATLALVEQDHDRMVIEREEIMEDVDRLERDMRDVRAEAAQIGRELEALRSVKEARKNEESTVDLQVEIIAQLRRHHIDECKGLMLRIKYLKAKWTREANFRSDLGYQKGFLQQLVGGLERDLASTQMFVADVSASRGLPQRARTPKNRLKEVMLTVRAAVRMR